MHYKTRAVYRQFLDLFSQRPEDDLIKVETCRPDSILFLLYINKVVFICYNTS